MEKIVLEGVGNVQKKGVLDKDRVEKNHTHEKKVGHTSKFIFGIY